MKLQVAGYADLGRQLRIAREKAGLTQEELARCLKIDQATVAKIEAGTRRVGVLKFAEICEVLAASCEAILKAARSSSVGKAPVFLTTNHPKPEYAILE